MNKIITLLSLLLSVTMIANAQGYTTLGIGINPPLATLHVHSSEGFLPPVVPGTDPGSGNRDYDYRTTVRITNSYTGTTAVDGFEIDQYNNDVTIRQWETGMWNFLRSNGQGFSLSSTGNFGIGTTTPTQKLHVAGSGLMEGSVTVGDILTVANRAVLCSAGQPLCVGKAMSLSWATVPPISASMPSVWGRRGGSA